jgi:hypothetical protein
MNRRRTALGSLVLLLGLGLGAPGNLEAQQRQQRVTPGRDAPAVNPAQAEILMERFAQRVAEALRLDGGQARRLQRELQTSRRERARITTHTREVRRELNQLIQQAPGDETQIGRLLDELVDLQGQAAMIAVDEQRRLSAFLSPLQRARYLYLRQRLVRRAIDRQGARTDVPPRDDPQLDFF